MGRVPVTPVVKGRPVALVSVTLVGVPSAPEESILVATAVAILLNSVSDAFPNGFGNSSEQVGHNLMDHHYGVGAYGDYEGFQDKYTFGRKPNGIYVPRFRNLDGGSSAGYLRGFGYQGGASRGRISSDNIGVELKEAMAEPGNWSMGWGSWGEHLPYYENKATLNKDKKDKWGLPTLDIDCEFKENEMKMRVDMKNSAAEMLSSTNQTGRSGRKPA